jgi:predicted dehydrogenase
MKIELEKGTIEVTEDYLKIREDDGFNKILYKPNYYQGFPPVNLADPEYTIEDMHFLTSLADGTKTMTELPNTLRSMELIDRLYESGQNG